jgi:DNA-binding NtrC family response regulator
MNRRTEDLVKLFCSLVDELAETGAFTLREFEAAARYQFVRAHLEQFKHNQSRTARALVIHRNTLRRILDEMRKAGVDPGRRPPKGRPASAVWEKWEKRSA